MKMKMLHNIWDTQTNIHDRNHRAELFSHCWHSSVNYPLWYSKQTEIQEEFSLGKGNWSPKRYQTFGNFIVKKLTWFRLFKRQCVQLVSFCL
jgi:hypothetical protein